MKRLLIAILLFLAIAPAPSKTMALSCAVKLDVGVAYENFDGVIIGKVVDVVSEGNQNNRVELQILKSFKGIEDNRLSILENSAWGSLWGPSVIGEEYLYYLKQTEKGWENPLCSPTNRVLEAVDDLAYLKDKEMPLKPQGAETELEAAGESVNNEQKDQAERSFLNWPLAVSLGCLILLIGYGIVMLRK